MKKWKTLKILLGVLCAVVAAIGLFACKKGGGNDIANITRTQGASNLSFTDDDQWSNIVSSLEKSVKLTCKPTKGDNYQVEGKDCNFTSTIEFDEANHCKIGLYTIRIQPKEKNPKNRYSEVNVEIVHAFEAEGEREVCSYCKATKTSAEEDSILHFGSFHSHGSTYNSVPSEVYGNDGTAGKAYTNNKANGTTYIEQFGTVQTKSGATYTMPTLTVGRLEPGMTITVKGTAQTAWSQWKEGTGQPDKDAGYYFPVIGIADRFLSNPVWEGEKRTDYVGGGTSIMVRGEGWVLYNGMDSSHADNDVVRMLGGLASTNSGSGEGRNYASHDQAEEASGEHRPSSYVQGQVPSVNEWVDWVAYSTGTISQSGAYSEEVQIELTWNYREDGVVELIYNVEGAKLVAMVKVPDATMGYYDTILHGDYVDMHITSYERIETRTPSEFYIDSVSLKNYYEGQEFDPATVSAKFKYEQTGDAAYTQALSLENFYASVKADADPENASDWVSLKDNPMSTSYEVYKAEIVKGAKTWRATFAKDKVNVVANVIESVYGGNCGDFKNNNTVGELTIGTDGTNITLTPKGNVYAQVIPDGVTMTGTTTASHRYVSLNVKASAALGASITAKNAEGDDAVPYYYSGTDGYLVLALTSTVNKVEVTGLQTTKTVFDFSKARGFNVESSIKGLKGWEINSDSNEVIITFKPVSGKTFTRVEIGAATRTLAQLQSMNAADAADFTRTNQFTLFADGTGVAEDGTITLKIAFAKAQLSNDSARTVSAVVDGVTDFVYEIDYKPAFVSNATVDNGYYNFVSGGKINLAKVAAEGDNALTLNVNEGNENVALIDLTYSYANGKASFKRNSVDGAEISIVKIGGEDIVLIEVDPTAYNVSAAKFGYQIKTEVYTNYYYAVVNNVAEKQEADSSELLIIEEGSCLEGGMAGSLNRATVNGEEVTFLTDISIVGGKHFVEDGKCTHCGATVTEENAPVSWFAPAGVTEDYHIYQTSMIGDGEFIEFIGKYSNLDTECGGSSAEYNAYGVLIYDSGSSEYIVNGHGHFMKWKEWWGAISYPGSDVQGYLDECEAKGETIDSNMTSSLITEDHPSNTINGWLDSSGKEITAESFNQSRVGATYRYTVIYQNKTLAVRTRVYVAGVDIASGTPLYDFTCCINNYTASNKDSIHLIGQDGFKYSNPDFQVVRGKLYDSVLTGGSSEGNVIAFGEPAVSGGYATIAASGMATQSTAIEGYTHKAEFTLSFSAALSATTQIVVKDAEGNAVTDATATLASDGKSINVLIPLTVDLAGGTYTLELKNKEGYTLQCDVKVDLANVAVSDIVATVSANTLDLAGGTFKITYAGEVKDDMKFVINGETKNASALAVNDVFGTLKVQSLNRTTAQTEIVFEQTALDFTKVVTAHTVFVYTANDKLQAQNTVSFNKLLPDTGVIEDAYVVGKDAKLTFVLTGVTAGSSKTFKVNVNKGGTIANADLVRLYDLSLKVSANGSVALDNRYEALTVNAVYSAIGGGIVAVTLDLSDLGIAAGDAYGIEAYIGDTGTAALSTMSATKVLTPYTAPSTPENNTLQAIGCEPVKDGITAKSDGDHTFYYDIEITAGGHVFPENGGECTRCGDYTGWSKDIKVGTTANNVVTDVNGDGKAYWPGANDAFSVIVPGQIITATGRLTASTSLGYANMNGVVALIGETTDAAASVLRFRDDAWVDTLGAGAGEYSNYGWKIVRTWTFKNTVDSDKIWSEHNTVREVSDAVITWDWTDTTKIVIIIQFTGLSTGDVYKQTHTITSTEEGGAFKQSKYAIGLTPCNGSLTGTLTAKGLKSVVSAENCNQAKHTHTFGPDGICTGCGEVSTEHTHNYDPATHVCSCGVVNPDASAHTFTNYICSVCHTVDVTALEALATEEGTMTNNDTTESWWGTGDNIATTAVTMTSDFVVKVTYKNATKVAPEAVAELNVGTLFLDMRMDNATVIDDVWTNGDSNPATITHQSVFVGTKPAEGDWVGDYTVYFWRVGTSYGVLQQFTTTGSDTVTYSMLTYGVMPGAAGGTVKFVGNPYGLTDFTVKTGTLASE